MRERRARLRGQRWRMRTWFKQGISWRPGLHWRVRPSKWWRNAVSGAMTVNTPTQAVCVCVCCTEERNTSWCACLVGYKICVCACLGFAGVSTPYKVAESLKTRTQTHKYSLRRDKCVYTEVSSHSFTSVKEHWLSSQNYSAANKSYTLQKCKWTCMVYGYWKLLWNVNKFIQPLSVINLFFFFFAAMQNEWGKPLHLCSVTFDREERPPSTNPGNSNMKILIFRLTYFHNL